METTEKSFCINCFYAIPGATKISELIQMQKNVRESALQWKRGDQYKTGKYAKILCNWRLCYVVTTY